MVEDIAVQRENGARERIVAAARHLFAARGFHQTAMADLAKEAKVSVGALYRSFDNKADIIRAIIRDDRERALNDLTLLSEGLSEGKLTVEQALEQLVLAQFSHKEDALAHEIMAEAHRNDDVADGIGDFCGHFRGMLGRIIHFANPALADEELTGVEELLLASMFGFAHRKLSRPELDEETTARIATKLILKALRV